MKTYRRIVLASLLFATLLTAAAMPVKEQDVISTQQNAEYAAAFKEFQGRVQAYVNLHRSTESTLPSLKSTDLPEMIAAHQLALARKIREARPNAKRGDIFSERTRKSFRTIIRSEFRGPQGHEALATIRQGAPLSKTEVHVNESYPDGVPFTTVPPTLLLKLPKLPDEVAYRIVGRDLILIDVGANLVIDKIPEIIP